MVGIYKRAWTQEHQEHPNLTGESGVPLPHTTMSTTTTMKPTRTDSYPTASSNEQATTETILAQHRPASHQPKPPLQRNLHLQYLVRNLIQGLPGRFVSQDASQPWLVFWPVQSFYFLGAGIDPDNKQRYVIELTSLVHINIEPR